MYQGVVFKSAFILLLLAFLWLAIVGLKGQLYQLEIKRYLDYWQASKDHAKAPNQALTERIASAIEQSQQSLVPINPTTWANIGRIYYWYAIFADQQGNKEQVAVYLQQAQNAYRAQTAAVAQWPYGYLLNLSVQAQQAQLSDDFAQLWQTSYAFAQQNGQVNFALAKQIPLLWSKLTPNEQKEALLVFYQAAVHSPQQASALVQLNHSTLTLLTATCLLAKAKQTPLSFCQ